MTPWSFMNLKILLPFKIFADNASVMRIVAESRTGSFGILPHRLDCVAPLPPGILTYECEGSEEAFVAVDQGILIKSGPIVFVSVRNAIGGMGLSELRDAVEREFVDLNESEREVRRAMEKMETGFISQIAKYHHD